MKATAVLLATLGLAFATSACSDPCGDIADCCTAMIEATDWSADPTGTMKATAQGVCDAYEDADSDACQAAIDAYQPTPGVDVPSECDF